MRTDLGITTKYALADSASVHLFEQVTRVLPGGHTPTTVPTAPCPPPATEGRPKRWTWRR